MKLRALAVVMGMGMLLASCSVDGPCCGDGDCLGNGICSQECSTDGNKQGVCMPRCQVDADCKAGTLCQEFDFNCACATPAVDAGPIGSCPQG